MTTKVLKTSRIRGFRVDGCLMLAALLALVASGTKSSAATSCKGKHVYSGANLVSVAAGAPAGTTFCIHKGTYRVSRAIRVQDSDRFIGVFSRLPRPLVITTRAQKVFNAEGSERAIIRGLRIEGAVGDESCQPECGRGISGGTQPHRS